jgi:hypothetical protein
MSDRLSESPGSSPDRPAPGAKSPAAAPRVPTAARPSSRPASLIVRGLGNLLAVGILVYLMYFFTMFFARPTQTPAPGSLTSFFTKFFPRRKRGSPPRRSKSSGPRTASCSRPTARSTR